MAATAPQVRRIRVLIADDHRLVSAAVARVLEQSGQFETVASVTRGSEVVPRVDEVHPDLLLLDLRMPELDGLGCLERVRQRWPDLPVIIVSASSDEEVVAAARERGATAYVNKSVANGDLATSLLDALERRVFKVYGTESASNGGNAAGLSDRELTMLRTLARGLSNKAIGREMWITEQTVKFHLTNIYRKLGVENRTQAIKYAYEHALVQPR